MSKVIKLLVISASLFMAQICLAVPPRVLITHNQTNVESNAFIAGTIPSRFPTKPNSDSKVMWTEVRLACFGHVTNGKCPALVRMATGPNDGGAVDLGYVNVDLNTGIITPSRLSANGYTLIVNGIAETTLIKN